MKELILNFVKLVTQFSNQCLITGTDIVAMQKPMQSLELRSNYYYVCARYLLFYIVFLPNIILFIERSKNY